MSDTAVDKIVCPHCGSADLANYRIEYGKPGDFRYSWEEGVECKSCRRIRLAVTLPSVPPTPVAPEDNDPVHRRPATNPEQKTHPWWCEGCGQWVASMAVTFGERHDERAGGCGGQCV